MTSGAKEVEIEMETETEMEMVASIYQIFRKGTPYAFMWLSLSAIKFYFIAFLPVVVFLFAYLLGYKSC